jgi:hypothetical protein
MRADMPKIRFEIEEKDLKSMVEQYLRANLGAMAIIDPKDIRIEVKSKQNFRSEWEKADFRAIYEVS